MRIAMIGPFGLSPNKTMQSRALSLARELVQKGHQVKLFMPPWQTPSEANRSWQVDGVEMRYVPLHGGILGITRQLYKEVAVWQPDVVHCFKPKAYSGLVAWWLWYFQRPFPLIVDTDDWEGWGGWNDKAPYTTLQKYFFAWQERWGMQHCDALTVASKTLQSLAWGQGVLPENVFYLPNGSGLEGIPYNKPQTQTDRPILLLYSRLFEFDVTRLVNVLAGVKTAVTQQNHPTPRIHIIGAGLYESDTHQLQAQLAKHNLLEDVQDFGWMPLDELPTLLAQADIGLYFMDDTLLNRTKCPVKLADMAYVGLPVVGEAVGQVSEYIQHGQTGFLHPTNSVNNLITDIVRLLTDPLLRRTFGQKAQTQFQAHFRWSVLANSLITIYEQAIKKKQEPKR